MSSAEKTPEHDHRRAVEGTAGPIQPAIRAMMMPKDTNALGTVFGGLILSYIDLAGAVEARRHAAGRLVTVAMREVVFVAPVYVGDLVSLYTRTARLGRTSVTVQVTVEVERQRRRELGARDKVTEAEVVFVHVDEKGQPIPLDPGDPAS